MQAATTWGLRNLVCAGGEAIWRFMKISDID